jgi:hypothetical protein
MEHEDSTAPDEQTRRADKADARHPHAADRPATVTEEADAESALGAQSEEERKEVARHEQEMMEIGASVKGEGRIDG